ncbi:MAG: sugar phosphate isomerase/epimerase, partial [Clostridia bacterium]|nr:sugar phosphate isomerase/epimerase [Clostridia bacterium]
MLKIGIQSYAYFGVEDYEQGMALMKAHGYDGFDYQEIASVPNSPLLKMSDEERKNYLSKVRQTAEKYGLEIHQLHGAFPCVDFATEEGCQKQMEEFKRSIVGAKCLGCPKIVVHPFMPGLLTNTPSEEEIALNIRLFKQLAPFAKDHGVTVCVENVAAPQGTIMSYIESIKKVLDGVNDPYIKACLDTGHFEAVGTDIYGAICLLGDHLAALHVHDSAFGQDRHLLPFQGLIDWNGFTRGLKDIGFMGVISLETQISSGTPQPMREQMQRALAGVARYLAEQASAE